MPKSARPYLKRANAVRRGGNVEGEENGGNGADGEEAEGSIELGEARYVVMSEAEQFVLTISEKWLRQAHGRPTSTVPPTAAAKASTAMAVTGKNGRLVASFPVRGQQSDHAGHRRRSAHPLPGGTASASLAARRKGSIVFLDRGGREGRFGRTLDRGKAKRTAASKPVSML